MNEQLPTDQPPASQPAGNPHPRQKRRGWQRLRRAIIWLILLPILLFLTFQLPVVQNALANYVASRIATTLESDVRIGKLRLSWLDELRIEDVFIEDKYGDTLLYGGLLEADLDLLRGLSIEKLTISNTNFKIRRDLGDAETNLDDRNRQAFPE